MLPCEQKERGVIPGSEFTLCPVGFLVHANGFVDPSRGCGHRKCFPSVCEIVKRLEPK